MERFLHLKLFLCGKFLNPVSNILKGEFWIERIGPVFVVFHEVPQVCSLQSHHGLKMIFLLKCVQGLTSWPFPLNFNFGNSFSRYGSPFSENILEGGAMEHTNSHIKSQHITRCRDVSHIWCLCGTLKTSAHPMDEDACVHSQYKQSYKISTHYS